MELLQAPDGDVVAEHRATLTYRIASVLFLALPGAAVLVLTARLPPGDDDRVPLAVCGAVLVALGVLAVLQQNKSRVVLRADGVERWGLRGKLWALRFSEMHELHYRVIKVRLGGVLGLLLPALGTNIHIAFTDPNGKKRKLPVNLKGMDTLAERISERQTAAHFPAARAKLDNHEQVQFGKSVALDKEKISVRKFFGGMKSCPLSEIEKFSVENGALRIRQRGKTFAFASVQTGRVPNIFLLLRLLDALLGQKPPGLGQDRDFSSQAYVG